jgi:hypothetical protein
MLNKRSLQYGSLHHSSFRMVTVGFEMQGIVSLQLHRQDIEEKGSQVTFFNVDTAQLVRNMTMNLHPNRGGKASATSDS